MTSQEFDASPQQGDSSQSEFGRLPKVFIPVVDWVARLETSVHVKLLFGFMTIAVLLLALGVLSIAVLARVDQQVDTITALHDQSDIAREMIYGVTAQSHFRAMALVTQVDSWDDKIYAAKDKFSTNLTVIRATSVPGSSVSFDSLEAIDKRFKAESQSVSDLYYAGDFERARELHIQTEHETSHDLENVLNTFIADVDQAVDTETQNFEADRRLLTIAVGVFSATSLAVALLLGAVLSWSLIRPVRRVDLALRHIADGDFEQRVEVPNRDEFGSLTANLNKTTAHLGDVYSDLESLNTGLQETVDTKVQELNRAARLRRYVSPQLAESILAGDTEVVLGSSRKYLTIFLSDIRGFTEMTENMEPEHLVDELNEYLTEMTEIVFRHGGTLDKYIGDAILVFFGDPIPQEDHAERALRMALEMQQHVEDRSAFWTATYGASFRIGIGVTTGWVTVGNIGSSARTDYTVLGNEVNLAARLADRAEAGEILVSERTMVKAEGIVRGELVDEVTLKGVSRPLKVYALDRAEKPTSGGGSE